MAFPWNPPHDGNQTTVAVFVSYVSDGELKLKSLAPDEVRETELARARREKWSRKKTVN